MQIQLYEIIFAMKYIFKLFLILFAAFHLNLGLGNSQEISKSVLKGKQIAESHCSRCHIITNKNSFGGIGSTPSFIGLKNLSDWKIRFSDFFVRPPHPALVNILEVTPERPDNLPAFVEEINLTLDDIDHLVNYIKTLEN